MSPLVNVAGSPRVSGPGLLQEHKKRQDAQRLALGDAWREHGLVFASTIGTPIEPRNVNRRWDEPRRKADLDWLRLHDLRHGCATFLLAQGVPARPIMEVLGHAEIGVTMNTYAPIRAPGARTRVGPPPNWRFRRKWRMLAADAPADAPRPHQTARRNGHDQYKPSRHRPAISDP